LSQPQFWGRVSCGALAGARQAASSAPAGGSIRLGAAGPISGGSAAFGLQFKEGVEQAVADINDAGGILGQKVTLVRLT